MSRLIKFRAWIIEEKKMMFGRDWFAIDPEEGLIQYADQGWYCNNANASGKYLEQLIKAGIEPKDQFVLMQFTGFRDDNDLEVYEGDIVEVGYGRGQVFFGQSCFLIKWIDDPEANIEFLAMTKKFKARESLKVIGNIHEHPNLLKPA